MSRFIVLFITVFCLAVPAWAADTEAEAGANVQVESEQGFFSRTWTGVKGFFGFEEEAEVRDQATAASVESETEAGAEAGAGQDESLINKAAESTKSGVDWTADKAKKGAEWTKETAVNVKDDAVGGAKAVGGAVKEGASKVGGAVKDVFTSDSKVEADAEASVESD